RMRGGWPLRSNRRLHECKRAFAPTDERQASVTRVIDINGIKANNVAVPFLCSSGSPSVQINTPPEGGRPCRDSFAFLPPPLSPSTFLLLPEREPLLNRTTRKPSKTSYELLSRQWRTTISTNAIRC